MPCFDSPAVFFRLLDRRIGGYCAIRLTDAVNISREYIEGTNILETTFTTPSGTVVITDFMPVQAHRAAEARNSIIRLARCTAGHVVIAFECKPSCGFYSNSASFQVLATGVVKVKTQGQDLLIEGPNLSLRPDDTIIATARLAAGEAAFFAISSASQAAQVEFLDIDGVRAALDATHQYWTEWSRRLHYKGDYRKEILRSILLLKLLTFAPTGAIVAAPTTSLPEVMGGTRNWDYRLCWIRDSQFVITSLMHCGYEEEAHEFFGFLRRTTDLPVDQLRILYDIRGNPLDDETEIAGLEGYRCSRPVRIGNAAGHQKQSDIYGELLNCIFTYCQMGSSTTAKQKRVAETWTLARALADYVVRHWREPDQGIWETRKSARQFVYSKAMCWTALDRALRLAAIGGAEGEWADWRQEREIILEDIVAHGFNTRLKAFVESYGSELLDAAVLLMPLQGVIPADDPRMLSTISQLERHLSRNGLLMRYEGGDPREGAFTSCTLWLINNYILLGRRNHAREALDHLLCFSNDLGLYSEEIDPESGEQLGNFPQALTHVALISALHHLEGSRPGSLHALP